MAYLNLGTSLIALGRCQEAASVLREGSKLDGTGLRDRSAHNNARMSALLQLGSLYAEQGKLQRALAVYKEALHNLPDSYPPQVRPQQLHIIIFWWDRWVNPLWAPWGQRLGTEDLYEMVMLDKTTFIHISGYLSSFGRHTGPATAMVRSRKISSGGIRGTTGSCRYSCVLWNNVG